MKKLVAFVAAALLALAVVGCAKKQTAPATTPAPATAPAAGDAYAAPAGGAAYGTPAPAPTCAEGAPCN